MYHMLLYIYMTILTYCLFVCIYICTYIPIYSGFIKDMCGNAMVGVPVDRPLMIGPSLQVYIVCSMHI